MTDYTSLPVKAERKREDQLQFLRFLAFLNVFIAHAEVWLFFSYPASHCSKSAVSFFFILSGGLTGYAGFGKERKLSIGAIGANMGKKLRKLYPLYFVTMLVPVLFSELPEQLAALDFVSAKAMLVQLGKNLLLIQSWFTEGYFSINGVGWFLSTLMFLNLWNLPALWLLNRLYRHPRGRYLLPVGLVGFLGITVVYCYVTQGWDMEFFHYIFPPARLGEYFSGMILGFLLARFKSNIGSGSRNKLLFTVLEAAALAYWFLSLSRPGNYWRNHIVSWMIPNLFLFAVFLIGKGWISEVFRWNPLVRLGDVSFECFLIHNLIIIWFLQANPLHQISRLGSAIAFMTCLLLSVFLSFMLNKDGKR